MYEICLTYVTTPPCPRTSPATQKMRRDLWLLSGYCNFVLYGNNSLEYFLYLHNYSMGGEREKKNSKPYQVSFCQALEFASPQSKSPKWSFLDSAYGNRSHYSVQVKVDLIRSTCIMNCLCPHCISYLHIP